MLEKIGLPAKPSMRGGSWVVDASHCQGCSSQFTFINRKHHCRRCGGLFCNSCTQQRMVLRGQGDSPVRICNPCKDLEDAARFERYGHKNRSTKGASKQIQKQEEDILNQILGTDGKPESHTELISDLHRNASSASSSSNLNEESSSIAREGDFVDTGSNTPEELRLQAVEEKKKYRILKGAGKPEEALQAFKRGKELERQAGALEIALRKNRKMASKASNHQRDEPEESNSKRKLSYQMGKEEKNDLASELRELGWSDADLHDAEKKTVKLTLEGELSTLIKEIPQKSSVRKKTGSIEKSEVIALKRKALQLKREGKLAEAKEELKRAKILEKQLEEQELLGESEDSDDELSALIRSMDDDKHDDLLLDDAPIPPIPDINFEHFLGAGDNFQFDDDFEVTDNDMNDPHLVAALKSFGWTGEDDEEDTNALDREALQCEVLTLKREALAQKREGNVSEAMSLLKKAKLLEKDLENIQPDVQNFVPESLPKRSISQVSNEVNVPKLPAKSKIVIQRELLALKKKALALRREGRIEEADEELRKGKALEQQLEEAEKALEKPAPKVGINNLEINSIIEEEGVEAEVTDQDMHDPALMSVLKNLGWNEDDAESAKGTNIKTQDMPSVIPQKSKVEIQRELLALKRKALSLRRQGKTEEAEEELERAKDLEKQLADIEASSSSKSIVAELKNLDPLISEVKSDAAEVDSPPKDQKVNSKGPAPQFDNISPILQPRVESVKTEDSHEDKVSPPTAPILQPTSQRKPEENAAEGIDAQKELILSHKKKAVALKREGKLSEAREELRKAKLLEKSLEPESHQAIVGSGIASAASSESTSKNSAGSGVASVSISESTSVSNASKTNLQQAQKPLTSSERFKLQRETLSHKRNALKLRREGKIEASEAELELAKALENQLEESNPQASSTSASEGLDDVGVEGLLDPQIMSALKSIGWGDNDLGVGPPKVSDPKPIADKSGDTQTKKTHLEEMIKSEKVRALNLKREGKQAEAMEALRSAKQFEKKLASLN